PSTAKDAALRPSGRGASEQSGKVSPPEGGRRFAGGGAEDTLPMTDRVYRRLEADPLAETLQAVREYVVELKERYQFFHWHVAFPDVFTVDGPHSPGPSLPQGERGVQVPPHEGEGFREGAYNPQTGWYGGFDVVLGNPPWEHTEIKEKEWFAERAPESAKAAGAKRKQLIDNLAKTDPYLYQAFAEDKRVADGFSHFVRTSGNYPLTGRGRINTYPLFTERSRHIINGFGRVGIIVPSG